MVLGFGKGPERFLAAKEQTPGPGAYDPKVLDTRLDPRSGFLTGERFSSQELEGTEEPAQASPPRERKIAQSGNDRKFSWATQRIHELTKELEAAQKRVKELHKALQEQQQKLEKADKELEAKLDEHLQVLEAAKAQLSSTESRLAESVVKEQGAAARVEQLALELRQVNEARALLEQQHTVLKGKAEDLQRKADSTCAQLAAAEEQLSASRVECTALRASVASLQIQCSQQTAEVASLKAMLEESQHQVVSLGLLLTAARTSLEAAQASVSDLTSSLQASKDEAQGLRAELAAARSEAGERGKLLAEVEAELASTQQRAMVLQQEVTSKEASVETLSARMAVQVSELLQQKLTSESMAGELEAMRRDVAQRDASIGGLNGQVAELEQQLTAQKAAAEGLTADLRLRHSELDSARAREQELKLLKAELEGQLSVKSALCEELGTSVDRLTQQVSAMQEELAAQTATNGCLTLQLSEARAAAEQQAQQLAERCIRITQLESEVALRFANEQQQAQLLTERAAAIEELQGAVAVRAIEVADLSSQLASQRSAAEATRSEMFALTQTLAQRDDSVAGLQSQMQQLTTSIASLQSSGEEAAGRIAFLEKVVTDRDNSIASMANETADLRATMAERDRTIASLTADLQVRIAASEQLNATVEHLQAMLSERESAAASLSTQLVERRMELAARDARVTQLLADAEAATQSAAAAAERSAAMEASFNQELAAARAALAEGAAREVALREQLATDAQRLKEMVEAKQLLDSDHAKVLVQAQRERGQLVEEVGALRVERSGLLSGLQEHSQERLALSEKLMDMEGQLAKAQEGVAALQAHVQQSDATLERQAAELEVLQDDLAARTSFAEELQFKGAALASRLSEVEAERDGLSQSLASERAALTGRDAQCLALRCRVAELEAALSSAAQHEAQLHEAMASLQAEMHQEVARATTVAQEADARAATLERDLEESRNANAAMGVDLAQLVTDLQGREMELKEMTKARNEAASSLIAGEAIREDLQTQLEELRRQALETQAGFAGAKARAAQMEAETESLRTMVASAQEEAAATREEALILVTDLDQARSQLRHHERQEQEMDNMRQELEQMFSRLQEAEASNAGLRSQIMEMQGSIASMTPICSRAKLDDQVRALSEALEAAHRRTAALEQKLQHDVLLEATAGLELRRLTEENDHLVARLQKMETDLKEQSVLGHNNHRQKIQYHLRLKQELEELRHECTVMCREKFQLEQCIRYLAVQVGMGPEGDRRALATADRKAIEKVLPSCLASNAMFTTPLSQRVMRLSARAKNNEQGTVYAGGKELFEEGIAEARRKCFDEINSWRNEAQEAVAVVSTSPTGDQEVHDAAEGSGGGAPPALAADGPAIVGSPDVKSPRGERDTSSRHAVEVGPVPFGTPIATIRGAGTPAPGGGTAAAAVAPTPQSLIKLEERIKLLIIDVCAPASTRQNAMLATGAGGPGTGGQGAGPVDLPAGSIIATSTMTALRATGSMRDRDQDKEKAAAAAGGKELGHPAPTRDRSARMSTASVVTALGGAAGGPVGNGSQGGLGGASQRRIGAPPVASGRISMKF
ncbi:hypothetical protein GPECTOR_12g381 [Gonium pectorale]|uniref:Uncharacterized protein n=1 Tax=Gonium pectorale TaxID=33097 RepID=A0A150GNL9_GONPE|nr:hypothetical protein GPECTOR_12g381 [Gonium pectorale]|eukprot:KXZ51419.1 hypothetical protein GPECTOR_12g381 [Gonium pectorale]